MFVNIRHAIRGSVVPLAYSNAREGFIFTTTVKRKRTELPPRFYYIDWKTQGLFRIEEGRATSEKRMVQLLRDFAASGGIDGMNLVKMRPDPEGDRVVQRILDHDDTVIPILGEKYLEYTPAPTEALLDHYIGEAEALTQLEEGEEEEGAVEEQPEPETTKLLEDILESMRGKVPEDQEEEITQRLYELREQAPEELGELLEMAQKMDNMTQEQAEKVGEEIQEAMGNLMDEVSESSKTLAKLLKETKKQSKANA